VYKCEWPEGCESSWFDMVTITDGDEHYDMPLCQRHHDLLVTRIIEVREELSQPSE
jgi:hypothetical protein